MILSGTETVYTGDEYIALSPTQIAIARGMSEEEVVDEHPGWASGMNKYVGHLVRIAKEDSDGCVRVTICATGRDSGFHWNKNWLKKVKKETKTKTAPTVKKIYPELAYKLTLDSGNISFFVKGEDIIDKEPNQDGDVRVNIMPYLNATCVAEWYILNELCTTDFGEHKQKKIIWVPISSLSAVEN